MRPERNREHVPEREIALRAHVTPSDWQPHSPRRNLAPWSEAAVLLSTLPLPDQGEPLGVGIVGVRMGRGIARRWLMHPDDSTSQTISYLVDVSGHRGWEAPISRADFAERFLYRIVYKRRIPLVGWRLPTSLGRLAIDWRAGNDFYADGCSLIFSGVTPEGRPWERPLRNGQTEDGFRPRIGIKVLGDGGSFMAFLGRRDADPEERFVEGSGVYQDKYIFPGHFIDTGDLGSALCGSRSGTLEELCDAFAVEGPATRGDGIDQLAEALGAVDRVYVAELEAHAATGVPIHPDRVHSSYAAGLFQAMGLSPFLPRWPEFPETALTSSLGGFHGGEAAAILRQGHGFEVPGRLLDLGGAYATSAVLSGAFEVLAAEHCDVRPVDPTRVRARVLRIGRRVRGWLSGDITGSPISPKDWRFLARTFVHVRPTGETLPHRAHQDGRTFMVVGPLTLPNEVGPLGIPLCTADLLSSWLDSSRLSLILEAWRLAPHGRIPLEAITLPDGSAIDPNVTDPFLEIGAWRAQLGNRIDLSAREVRRWRGWAKRTLASACYGVLAEVDEIQPTKGLVRTLGGEDLATTVEEKPGTWYFPPVPTGTTAIARLLLHLIVHTSKAMGGTVAYIDTDAVFVVATRDGGVLPCPGGQLKTEAGGKDAIRALSFADVERLRERIEELSPYASEARPDGYVWEGPSDVDLPVKRNRAGLLKLEPENRAAHPDLGYGGPASHQLFIAAFSSRHYALYHRPPRTASMQLDDEGRPRLVWSDEAPIKVVKVTEIGLAFDDPEGDASWREHGAMFEVRSVIEGPGRIEEPTYFNSPALRTVTLTRPEHVERLAAAGARPWCTALVGVVSRAVSPEIEPVIPVTLRSSQAGPIQEFNWWDLSSGKPIDIRLERLGQDDRLKTMREVFAQFRRTHDRGKRLDARGAPLSLGSRGLTQPAPTIVSGLLLVGKDTRRVDLSGWAEQARQHVYQEEDLLPRALSVLEIGKARLGLRGLAARLRIPTSTLGHALSGRPPSDRTRDRLIHAAGIYARAQLTQESPELAVPQPDAIAMLRLLRSIN
jgi:hypothetical protein